MVKNDFLWVYERCRGFLGCKKKTTRVAIKELRDCFGYAKKVVIFLGRQNSEVVIFLGIKYEPLLDPPPPLPPPIIKICEWGPWL